MVIYIGEGAGNSTIVWREDEGNMIKMYFHMLTCAGIKVGDFKLGLKKFNGGDEARALDAVLVEVTRMSARNLPLTRA
jgi:hypothetical protein